MRRLLLALGAALSLSAGAANAATVSDPTGDFLASFAGPPEADLDVTRFAVSFDAAAQAFHLDASLAGPIDASTPGLYAIGVNTGTGPAHPFDGIGEPNVIFNQVVVLTKAGSAFVGAHGLASSISGSDFSITVPLGFLPSTGFDVAHYAFNLWPRTGLGDNSQISDFAPQNAMITAVPEPAGWALMTLGVLGLGGVLRWRTRGARSLAALA
jgi:hypothetical protein